MWFKEEQGYGLIAPDDGERNFVVWWASIAGWPKTLAEGDRVEFEVRRGPKGLEAVAVKALGCGEEPAPLESEERHGVRT